MTDWSPHIQTAMQQTFPQVGPRVQQFYAMQSYHLGWRDAELQPVVCSPGKLLRPTLVLLACQAVGGDAQRALPLAAAVQLLHDFTLIHDDIEDDSATRRGRTTVWKQWGLAQGINTGDGMLAQAHLALTRLADSGLPAATILQAFTQFDQAFLLICEGQYLDISFEGQIAINTDDYLAMIERKTAALFAACASLGALAGGADPTTIAALQTFGRHLGMAFQMQDDLLGIWGTMATTGKREADDLWQRKVTLPIIYALEHSYQRVELAQRYAREPLDSSAIQRILDILDASGARADTECQAIDHYQQAMNAFDQVPPTDDPIALGARRALGRLASRTLTQLLLNRQAQPVETDEMVNLNS